MINRGNCIGCGICSEVCQTWKSILNESSSYPTDETLKRIREEFEKIRLYVNIGRINISID
jgi:ferredoxin